MGGVIQQLDRTGLAMLMLLPDSQAGHALTRQDWVNKRISWRTPESLPGNLSIVHSIWLTTEGRDPAACFMLGS